MKESQPALEHDEANEKSRLCLNDGQFTAYLNEEALASLLWHLWWLAAEASHGEDVSLSSFWQGELLGKGTAIGYCEMTLAGEGKSKNPVAKHLLRLKDDRLDLFVTREPAKEAFSAVQTLGFDKASAKKTQIFGLISVVLLPDAQWPKPAKN